MAPHAGYSNISASKDHIEGGPVGGRNSDAAPQLQQTTGSVQGLDNNGHVHNQNNGDTVERQVNGRRPRSYSTSDVVKSQDNGNSLGTTSTPASAPAPGQAPGPPPANTVSHPSYSGHHHGNGNGHGMPVFNNNNNNNISNHNYSNSNITNYFHAPPLSEKGPWPLHQIYVQPPLTHEYVQSQFPGPRVRELDLIGDDWEGHEDCCGPAPEPEPEPPAKKKRRRRNRNRRRKKVRCLEAIKWIAV
ncbi:hypothetical protein B0T17DRAFT_504162 [Bombardia bombarda]|uniref:Uncharacterized protein n=1 Tax=Bombardia bombarda TaxID=252184 RepID=A0AA39XNY1_9PEZI|nr:hypothetical protein B0T17DRAFT_504162 [Bombardia bombarda]